MKVVIISATDFEVQFAKKNTIATKAFDVAYCNTGIGMLSTAINLSKIIYTQKPNFIIQAGIAGKFQNKNATASLGEVVTVYKEIIADLGVQENGKWKDIFDLYLAKKNNNPYSNKSFYNNDIVDNNLLQLSQVSAISVNQISSCDKMIQVISQKYNPTIESMEGAALHQTCNAHNIKYIQLRAISNWVGERDKLKWELKNSIDNLNNTLLEYLQVLQQTV
jgi:futalosine hydrolase